MKNVTVLIATYNHGSVLVYQIESLLRQTSRPKSIIVLDDGSTDETSAILERYRENPEIRVIRKETNAGVHAAITQLLDHVSTEFFAFAAADDILTRDWCAITASLLEANPDAKMVISNTFIFKNGRISSTDAIVPPAEIHEGVFDPIRFVEQLLRYGKFPPTNTIMYRSDIIDELIRPTFLRRELGPLVDVILLLAIATKYPIAYSIQPTGVFSKSSESYGNSLFNQDALRELLSSVESFALRDGYIRSKKLLAFLKSYAEYTWGKQIVLRELILNRGGNKGLVYITTLIVGYTKLVAMYLHHGRFRFFRFGKSANDPKTLKLEKFVDRSLLKRFDLS